MVHIVTSEGDHSFLNCVVEGGFSDFMWPCIKESLVTLLAFVTLIICVAETVRICKRSRRYFSYALLVMYLGVVLAALLFIRYGFLPFTAINFFIIYFSQLELCVVSYYFCAFALRVLQRNFLRVTVLFPVYCVIALAMTAVLVIAVLGLTENGEEECKDPSFLVLSTCGAVFGVAFAVAAGIAHRALASHASSENIKRRKRRELIGLVFFFLLSIFVQFFWNVILMAVPCDFGLGNLSFPFNAIDFTYRIVVFFLPLWTAVIIFHTSIRLSRRRSHNRGGGGGEVEIKAPYANLDEDNASLE
eukprot:TRINITY_DN4121_c0_g2_i1.p1 TRINITY_DN4121_c0_g2~~TRINITY_DN4121_c0_g2_i1.p1  ORF type:complete len:303 (-),score=58.05 TRINITY_DN4121_c0_g2_i1:104-1012(-)